MPLGMMNPPLAAARYADWSVQLDRLEMCVTPALHSEYVHRSRTCTLGGIALIQLAGSRS